MLEASVSTQHQSRRYKEIFENSSDAVFVIEVARGGKYRFESLNPAAVELLDRDGLKLERRRVDEVARRFRRSDGVIESLLGHLDDAVRSGMPVHYQRSFQLVGERAERTFDFHLVPMVDDEGLSHLLCFGRDVTSRKLYEQELLQRVRLEERLSGFAESAPGFFFSYRHGADGSNTMPFASAGITRLFGLQPEEVERTIAPMNLRMQPDDMGNFIEATARSAVDASPLNVEFRVNHPQRGELWVEARATPVMQEDGGIVWHGFMHDVTLRKTTEQNLQEAHAFTESIINAISDPIFVKDRQHRWVMLNDACCALIGYPREELIGKSDYDFFPKAQADEFWAGDERVFASGKVDVNEEAITPGNGETHYIQTKKTPYHLNGESHLIAVIRDISERRKIEDELRRSRASLAEAQRIGQMGSWELDLLCNRLEWSDEVFRIFEIDPRWFGASYEAFLNAIHPEDRDAVEKAYRDSLEKRTAYSIDHRLLFPDGRIKHVRECCETYFDAEGKALRSHGTVQDITALKVTEQQLKDTQDKLRELMLSREALRENERKRISWEMHEELGQILASMKMRMYGMRSQLPKDNPALGEESRAIVGLIDKSIKTIHDLASDLRPTVLLHGIVPSLEWLVAEFNKHPEIECELEIGAEDVLMDDELVTLIFRIAQEALAAVARHAGVSRVLLGWSSSEKECCLTIRHDGYAHAGDLSAPQPIDLFGIEERVRAFGGEMRIYSELQHRSVIEIHFPMFVLQ